MIKINNTEIKHFIFPGGECQVALDDIIITAVTQIEAFLDNTDEIMKLLLTVDAIRRINGETKIHLTLPYLPYARQDRVCNKGEALSIKVMADLINTLEAEQVHVFDPHSEVASALINNVVITQQDEIALQLRDVIYEEGLVLISPDAGAEKKIYRLAKNLHQADIPADVITASKKRDTKTGYITETNLHGDVTGRNVIIIDDICDGGRTFIELAKTLKKEGAEEIYLYVTHGIFSKGLEALTPYFKHIFCYYTFLPTKELNTEQLTILKTN